MNEYIYLAFYFPQHSILNFLEWEWIREKLITCIIYISTRNLSNQPKSIYTPTTTQVRWDGRSIKKGRILNRKSNYTNGKEKHLTGDLDKPTWLTKPFFLKSNTQKDSVGVREKVREKIKGSERSTRRIVGASSRFYSRKSWDLCFS